MVILAIWLWIIQMTVNCVLKGRCSFNLYWRGFNLKRNGRKSCEVGLLFAHINWETLNPILNINLKKWNIKKKKDRFFLVEMERIWEAGGGGWVLKQNFKIYIVSSSEAALTPMKSCWAQFYFWLSNTLYHFLERAYETSKQIWYIKKDYLSYRYGFISKTILANHVVIYVYEIE